jgi:hypothetical protein
LGTVQAMRERQPSRRRDGSPSSCELRHKACLSKNSPSLSRRVLRRNNGLAKAEPKQGEPKSKFQDEAAISRDRHEKTADLAFITPLRSSIIIKAEQKVVPRKQSKIVSYRSRSRLVIDHKHAQSKNIPRTSTKVEGKQKVVRSSHIGPSQNKDGRN